MEINKNISLLLITQLRTTSHLCSFDYYLVLISFSRTLDISCKNCLINSILFIFHVGLFLVYLNFFYNSTFSLCIPFILYI
ncbi:transposase [Orientia tsutsugamushi str. Ikeda]|uniref:Transposase n=1 Tax=Orientia tsutsugamushi (strain Ikeda) TaxID=334380 RepID=B3CV31_ORITI|nr:transposase [Orientia tsutsugamushi str. Ikeda]